MPAWLVVALIATVFVWPLRLLGRWMQRKGREMERRRGGASRWPREPRSRGPDV